MVAFLPSTLGQRLLGPARPPVPLHGPLSPCTVQPERGGGWGEAQGRHTHEQDLKKRRKTTIRPRGLSCLGGSRCRRVTETRLDMLAGGSRGRFCGRRKESTGSAPFEKRVSRVQQGDFIFFKGQCLNLRSDPPGERACGRPAPPCPQRHPPGFCAAPGPLRCPRSTWGGRHRLPLQLWPGDTSCHRPRRVGHPPSPRGTRTV